MITIRRVVTGSLIGVFSLAAFSASAAQAGGEALQAWKKIRLSPRILVMCVEPAQRNNTVVIAGEHGLAVIDANLSASFAKIIRAEAEREFGRSDFRYVINTHEDWDHSFGNYAFPEAEIIGHILTRRTLLEEKAEGAKGIAAYRNRCASFIERFKKELAELTIDAPRRQWLPNAIRRYEVFGRDLSEGFRFVPPTIAFDDRMTLDLGGLTIEMVYFGKAHRTDDILVRVPAEGLLATGDLSFDFDIARAYDLDPSYRNGMDVSRWLAVLSEALADPAAARTIVRGHGPALTVEGTELAARVEYLGRLWSALRAARRAGRELKAVQAELEASLLTTDVQSRLDWWGREPLSADVVRQRQARLAELLWEAAGADSGTTAGSPRP